MANNGNPTGREAAAERRVQALILRKAGASYRAIAAQLGVSPKQAYCDVTHELDKIYKQASELAEQVRTLELERLDGMLLAISKQVSNGSLGAIDRSLRIMERRAKLLGLDAPSKSELTGKDGGVIRVTLESIND
jgi:hypothetical protein